MYTHTQRPFCTRKAHRQQALSHYKTVLSRRDTMLLSDTLVALRRLSCILLPGPKLSTVAALCWTGHETLPSLLRVTHRLLALASGEWLPSCVA